MARWVTKAPTQEPLAYKNRYRAATEVAFAALICAGLRGCSFVGWEYTITGRWWATLMRHYFFTRPPLRLAPRVRMTTFAAVLVALGGRALGATSGLARTRSTAVALTAVARAADDYSAATEGAQKEPGWRLGSGHGQSSPCVKSAPGQPRTPCEILRVQRCSPVGPRGATVGLPASY